MSCRRQGRAAGLVRKLLDEHGPASSLELCGRRDGRLLLLGAGVAELVRGGAGLVRSGLFGSYGAGLVGVVAVIADDVFAIVGDVLDQFREQVKGSQDLEVAGRGAKEIHAGRLGKT